ncbi:hypothetical protein [Moheibacter stercoris]|uniref:Uncharacterized protein n=1 Tax=Moheibacter stercoris TaxID=1628251 RepID=A0ABV2LVW5_9FLAO
MQRHKGIFNEFKKLLKDNFAEKLIAKIEDEDEFLEIQGSPFWLMKDTNELIVGYGVNHTHFSDDFNKLDNGINLIADLLTNRIKTTNYIKGNYVYKSIVEIEFPDSTTKILGKSTILIHPFWRKKKIETTIEESLIEKHKIQNQLNLIMQIK